MKAPTKTLKYGYNNLDLIMCRSDHRGGNLPVSIRYCTKDGEVIEADNVVCTSTDHARRTRRVKMLDTVEKGDNVRNAATRTLRDCLILQVDDYKIVKS